MAGKWTGCGESGVTWDLPSRWTMAAAGGRGGVGETQMMRRAVHPPSRSASHESGEAAEILV
jgi:GTPase involved in cell partitioning and DNA repair